MFQGSWGKNKASLALIKEETVNGRRGTGKKRQLIFRKRSRTKWTDGWRAEEKRSDEQVEKRR